MNLKRLFILRHQFEKERCMGGFRERKRKIKNDVIILQISTFEAKKIEINSILAQLMKRMTQTNKTRNERGNITMNSKNQNIIRE